MSGCQLFMLFEEYFLTSFSVNKALFSLHGYQKEAVRGSVVGKFAPRIQGSDVTETGAINV